MFENFILIIFIGFFKHLYQQSKNNYNHSQYSHDYCHDLYNFFEFRTFWITKDIVLCI